MTDDQPAGPERSRGEMPFLDHLEELRWRLVKSLIAIGVGVGGGYALVTHYDVIAFLKRPINAYLPPGQKLLFTSPMEPFVIALKLSLAIGAVVALPVVLYQVWGFLRPALYQKERRVVVPALVAGVGLFVVGSAVGFYLVLPLTFKVLLGFSTESMQQMITADAYFSLTLAVVLIFGAVFEMPLLMFLLIYMRILSAAFLRRHHRTFFLVNAVASSILTPGDLVIMTLIVMVPVQLFYELAIVMAMILERRRARAEREQAGEASGVPAAGPA